MICEANGVRLETQWLLCPVRVPVDSLGSERIILDEETRTTTRVSKQAPSDLKSPVRAGHPVWIRVHARLSVHCYPIPLPGASNQGHLEGLGG